MMRLGWTHALGALAMVITLCAFSVAEAQTLAEEQAAMDGEGAAGTDDPAGEPASSDGGAAAQTDSPQRLDDEQAEIADEETREVYRDSTDPIELEDEDYFFLGAFSRAIIIPGFIQSLFVDGGIDGFNPALGLTFNWRRNDFNIIANVWWNNAAASGYFRASGDPATDTEFIDVQLGVIFVNASFMWSFPIVDWFAIELGFDLGIGFIYGELVRTEAYETSPGSGEFRTCSGPGDGTGGYCEAAIPASQPCYNTNGGQYDCREPNWFTEGGDTPFVFPWVSLPHIAMRFKPIHQVQIRVDGGFGLYNFFFGGSVSYGF